MKLEERLRDLRQAAGLSQADMAERMDVSRQAVSRWETGIAAPSAENLMELGRLYGVTLDELVYGAASAEEEEPPAPEPAALEPPAGAGRKQGRRVAVWLAALLCLLTLLTGLIIGYIVAPKPEKEFLDMADMKREEVEGIPEQNIVLEGIEERG